MYIILQIINERIKRENSNIILVCVPLRLLPLGNFSCTLCWVPRTFGWQEKLLVIFILQTQSPNLAMAGFNWKH